MTAQMLILVGDRRSPVTPSCCSFPDWRGPNDAIAHCTTGPGSHHFQAWAESTFESAQPTFLGDYTWLTVLNGKVDGV